MKQYWVEWEISQLVVLGDMASWLAEGQSKVGRAAGFSLQGGKSEKKAKKATTGRTASGELAYPTAQLLNHPYWPSMTSGYLPSSPSSAILDPISLLQSQSYNYRVVILKRPQSLRSLHTINAGSPQSISHVPLFIVNVRWQDHSRKLEHILVPPALPFSPDRQCEAIRSSFFSLSVLKLVSP